MKTPAKPRKARKVGGVAAAFIARAQALFPVWDALEKLGNTAMAEGAMHNFIDAMKVTDLAAPGDSAEAEGYLADAVRILDEEVTADPVMGAPLLGVRECVAAMLRDLQALRMPEVQAEFMAGKALAAALIGEAWEADDGSGRSSIEAGWRGRGVPQHDFARRYLEAVAADPRLIPGFSAVLSDCLGRAGNVINPEGELKALTYEECVGGPGIEYHVEDAPTPAAAPLQQPEADEQEERRLLAIEAGSFIAKVVDYYSNGAGYDRAMPAGDLLAIERAASVVMSALGDEVATVDDLRDKLEDALSLSTLLFLGQPPADSDIEPFNGLKPVRKDKLAKALRLAPATSES